MNQSKTGPNERYQAPIDPWYDYTTDIFPYYSNFHVHSGKIQPRAFVYVVPVTGRHRWRIQQVSVSNSSTNYLRTGIMVVKLLSMT